MVKTYWKEKLILYLVQRRQAGNKVDEERITNLLSDQIQIEHKSVEHHRRAEIKNNYEQRTPIKRVINKY